MKVETMYHVIPVLLVVLASHTDAKECTNLPPGLSKMVRGVDVSKLDLLPIDVVGDDGVMSPVIPITCDKGKQYKSAKGTVYELPDQVWQMTSVPGGWLSSEAHTYTSYSDVRNAMSASVGLEADTGTYAFSGSFSYKKMQNSITNSSRYISEVTAFAAATRADVNPPEKLGLDSFAQAYVDTTLTGTFESNPTAYNKFIDTYGTHYFTSANFGGFIRMVFETKKDYVMTKTENEIEANAKASYSKMVSVSVGGSSATGNVDETFTSNSKTTIKYYGGDTNVLGTEGLSKWQPTVESDPWLFSGKLKPISDLISDETKRTSMERAVKNRLLKAYIGEMQSLIYGARAKSDNPVINGLRDRVAALKSKKQIDDAEVDALAKDLEEYITVPNWFVANTKVCLYWEASWTSAQCNGGDWGNYRCAIANSMTPWYYDWTDWRIGGCYMQWAILSANNPAWFNDVQICYQWYAENNWDQCGGNPGDTYCASINSYTTKYFDDTGSRSGGCKMRWKLQVPDTAPYWMKAVHMCYKWEASDDASQCGGGAPTEQCVVANTWTAYYLDYTDNRSGGCLMSWGLKTAY
ncbi:perivitellin-2 67 kDa subunit-like [Physella acuta]|uniref:perivitellin-2 67 kDa subunit-like n=1 Tax=Physella acuta TaxID=109671 RepID=UPI0027DE3865|nr:perivitellin-2 67 kDa subunit-like [Physella acuta]